MSNNLELIISDILKELGVTPGVLGYDYLGYAIKCSVYNVKLTHRVTTKMYPMVAVQFGSTGTRVERAIRHAIEKAWNMPASETREKLFKNTVCYYRGKPTNGEFVATVSDYLRIMYKEDIDGN